jgi:hypothetical protein
MTRFRALRNFLLRPGVDVVAGDMLELDDAEAMLFVSMPGTVEPVDKRDRHRVVSAPRIMWESPADHEQHRPGCWVPRFAERGRRALH